MPKPIALIVACSENRVIGRKGQLPWRIPEDTAWFHAKTAGQIIILGRVCFETWPQVTQDGRRPIVITRDKTLARPGVLVAGSVTEALALAETLPGGIMVCGGQRIYEATLPLASRLYLTLVHTQIEGDTFFPDWTSLSWQTVEHHESSDQNFRYAFNVLKRALS